jgi:hypothetical protein
VGDTSSGKSSLSKLLSRSPLFPVSKQACTGYPVELIFGKPRDGEETYVLTHQGPKDPVESARKQGLFGDLKSNNAADIFEYLSRCFRFVLADAEGKLTKDPRLDIVAKIRVADVDALPFVLVDTPGPRGKMTSSVMARFYNDYKTLILTVKACADDAHSGRALGTLTDPENGMSDATKIIVVVTHIDELHCDIEKWQAEFITKARIDLGTHLEAIAFVHFEFAQNESEVLQRLAPGCGILVGIDQLRQHMFRNYIATMEGGARAVAATVKRELETKERNLAHLSRGVVPATVAFEVSQQLELWRELLAPSEEALNRLLVQETKKYTTEVLAAAPPVATSQNTKYGNTGEDKRSLDQSVAERLVCAIGDKLALCVPSFVAALTAPFEDYLESVKDAISCGSGELHGTIMSLWDERKEKAVAKMTKQLKNTCDRIRVTGNDIPKFPLEGAVFEGLKDAELTQAGGFRKRTIYKLLCLVLSQLRDESLVYLNRICRKFKVKVHDTLIKMHKPLVLGDQEAISELENEVAKLTIARDKLEKIMSLIAGC